jgi:primosomal protein N' (replication factor Y)
VSRLREEIEAAAGRTTMLITGDARQRAGTAPIYVGTEAALHRVERADTVAFLEFDRELLAPRYRAGEQAMALLARAARLVGPRKRRGRILVQTFLPMHPVVQAAVVADPGRLVDDERHRRRALALPPFGALAEISGAGSDQFVASLPASERVTVAGGSEHYVARAADWITLGTHLIAGVRPPGSRLRIAVDPAR